ncbi:UNVERIFIED_CONTAM: hypothetical protein GTU68_034744 [Idotea baltica]|nr:hypothetical protein [Idotea baltica]
MTFQLPGLPYALNALEPYMSAEMLELHHARHHRKYVDKLNALAEEMGLTAMSLEELIQTQDGRVFENAAQAWNHAFYWNCMTPPTARVVDGTPIQRIVQRDFGDFETLRLSFREAALSVFGSGWAWLVQGTDDRLEVMTTKDADCPLRIGKRPILTCDVWEHAYYPDYKNKRARYLDSWWEIVNWEFASENLRHELVARR